MKAPGTTPQTVADVLDAAADLLTPEGAWTPYAAARGAEAFEVDPTDDEAKCWCIIGAVSAVNGVKCWGPASAQHFLNSLFPDWHDEDSDVVGAALWNDALGRTQAEVIAKLREAAQLARQGQPA
jgi:hypothetical protein